MKKRMVRINGKSVLVFYDPKAQAICGCGRVVGKDEMTWVKGPPSTEVCPICYVSHYLNGVEKADFRTEDELAEDIAASDFLHEVVGPIAEEDLYRVACLPVALFQDAERAADSLRAKAAYSPTDQDAEGMITQFLIMCERDEEHIDVENLHVVNVLEESADDPMAFLDQLAMQERD
ncbi:MAG: hypothetical protein PHW53_02835 [Patescibacteria group bacterium]|nr:hypothetical protein [Patescibacteria group bacterium]